MPQDQITAEGRSILVDEILRRDHATTLAGFLRHARGEGQSYETIARRLVQLVDVEGFNVSWGSVRRWCRAYGTEPIEEESA